MENFEAAFFQRPEIRSTEIEFPVRQEIKGILGREMGRLQNELLNKWFNENQTRIQEAGFDTSIETLEYRAQVAKTLGGFEEMRTDERYSSEREKIDTMDLLSREFSNPQVSLEAKYLALRILSEKEEEIETKIKEINPSLLGSEKDKILSELFSLTRERERLSKLRAILGESIAGKSLKREVLEETKREEIQNRIGVDLKVESDVIRKGSLSGTPVFVTFSLPERKFIGVYDQREFKISDLIFHLTTNEKLEARLKEIEDRVNLRDPQVLKNFYERLKQKYQK